MNATIGCDSNGAWSYLGANNDDVRPMTMETGFSVYLKNANFI